MFIYIPISHIMSMLTRSRASLFLSISTCVRPISFFSFSGFLAFGPRTQINAVDEVEETHFANGVYFPMSRTLHEIPWAAHDDGKEGSNKWAINMRRIIVG